MACVTQHGVAVHHHDDQPHRGTWQVPVEFAVFLVRLRERAGVKLAHYESEDLLHAAAWLLHHDAA